MMIGASFALVALLGQLPSPALPSEPSALIAQLGSPRYAQRQAAASALERLGRDALPSLRSAREVRDPEIRTRAATLITRIEGALLTRPTLVALDFQDRPLAEVVRAVGAQSGVKMAVYPENVAAGVQKRITLHEPAPLPFWKALDRLCDVAQLQYNFGGMHGGPNARETVFPLYLGGTRPAGPMFDSGPFRVNLVGLHYQRDLSFVPNVATVIPNRPGMPAPPAPLAIERPQGHTINEQFFAQVQIAAEPRLSLSLSGPLRILEAIDDRGQSLMLPAGGAMTQHYSGYFGLTAGSTLHLHAPLKRPAHPGQVIKRLRGVLPVIVATRKPGPLVVPLSGATGKSFQNADVTLLIQDVRVNPNSHQTSIELSVRAKSGQAGGGDLSENLTGGFPHRPETHQQQIEVLDAQGRPIPWYHSSDAEGARMTLILTPQEQGTPSEIRYYTMAKATAEVGFEFNDVPLP